MSIVLAGDTSARSLRVEGERVAAFGPAAETRPAPGDRVLDAAGTVLAPGRVNAHTHVYSGLAPFGMPPPRPAPESFVEILERIWWRLDRALDEATLRAAARLYVAESLRFGTTTLVDHHESPGFIEGSLDVLADACDELGIRAILCYGATERNGGREEARRGLAECRRFVVENRRPLVQGVVGLHASFTVSDETVREAGELCRELETVMHVHLAEDGADVEDARRRGFEGPLERLRELGALPPGSILAHGVHLGAAQVRRARELGLWIVQNPRSNRGNRVGYPSALSESDLVALGTDGYPANLDDETDALREEASRHEDSRFEARPERGHELVAQRFGMLFAPLQPGAAADVCARKEGRARHAVVGGRLVVEEDRLSSGDLAAIRTEAEETAPALWEKMAALV